MRRTDVLSRNASKLEHPQNPIALYGCVVNTKIQPARQQRITNEQKRDFLTEFMCPIVDSEPYQLWTRKEPAENAEIHARKNGKVTLVRNDCNPKLTSQRTIPVP